MAPPDTPRPFSQFIRAENRFTTRDLMKALGVGHGGLKQREADPSLFTVGELLLLAKLLNCSQMKILKMVTAELERSPKTIERLEKAVDQVVGRKNFPRTPKAEKPALEKR